MPEEKEVTPPATEELLPPSTKTPSQNMPNSTKPKNNIPTEKQEPAKRIEFTDEEPIKKKKPAYTDADKKSLYQILKEILPKHLIPTDRMGKTLGIVFLIVVLWALIQFPYGQFLKGDLGAIVEVGWPYIFLEFGIIEAGETPLIMKNLIIDLIIYIFISYIIDVMINVILDIRFLKTARELEAKPKVFKDQKPSVAEKLTNKIFTDNSRFQPHLKSSTKK